jgi:GEVED domain/Secretion system C-terminal sorting domain/HYR domain
MKNNFLLFWMFVSSVASAQTYCACKGTSPWKEWIAKVQFGTINNSSIKEGFGDFTSQATSVKRGMSYPITVIQGFSWITDPSNTAQQGRVWIDFNQNGIFDPTELAASFSRNATTANVTIPKTAKLGNTRMRISLKTIGIPMPCDTFERGEVEDYILKISDTTIVSTNNCLNRFELTNFGNASCVRNTPTVSYNFGVLQQYAQTIAAGFQLSLIDPLNRVQLYARNGVSTPQVGAKYRNCPANWVYFTAFGDNVLNDAYGTNKEYSKVYLRVRPFGNAQNLDSVYVELDSTSFRAELNYLMPRVWGTISKTQKCSPCFTATPPTISNCPTTPIVNFKTTCRYEQINGFAVAQQLNIGFKDNCGNLTDYETTKYTLPNSFMSRWDSIVPFRIIQMDSLGNKSTCSMQLRIVPNCASTELYPMFVTTPKDTTVQAPTGKTCVAVKLIPPTTQSFIRTVVFNNLPANYCFPIGITPVTYTVRDSCGHANVHTLRVTVKAPTVTTSLKSKDYEDKTTDFEVFPNPAQREAFIHLKNFENQPIEISISDVAGKVFYHQKIVKASALPHRLDLSSFENGVYFVHIQGIGSKTVAHQLHILN